MNQNKFSMNKLFWGLLFLLGAAALLLNRLNYWPTFHHLSVFKIIVTIFFIWMILEGIRHRNFFCILFGIALIVIQYDDLFYITALTPWTLLSVALLASIGLTIIFPKRYHSNIGANVEYEYQDVGKRDFNGQNDEILHFENSFGSSIKYVNTDALVSASFQNSFGEMKIYFDNAIIKNGVADINLEISFGNAILFIPKTWNIEKHIKTTFGSLREQNMNQSQGCPTLRIYGEISFGEATIIYI